MYMGGSASERRRAKEKGGEAARSRITGGTRGGVGGGSEGGGRLGSGEGGNKHRITHTYHAKLVPFLRKCCLYKRAGKRNREVFKQSLNIAERATIIWVRIYLLYVKGTGLQSYRFGIGARFIKQECQLWSRMFLSNSSRL